MDEWWERFELESNPLTLRTQFSTPEQFNSLLVETKIFKKYKNLMTNPKNLMNRVVMITGEYGSGKTVLFDYIKFLYLKFTDIMQKTIFLGELYPSSLVMKDDFYSNLYYELTKQIVPVVSEINVIKALSEKKDELGLKGFILIIDEIHKNPDHQVTLEFLRHLQGFYQKIQNIMDITIIVVGREEWIDRIENNPQYSGTIAEHDSMSYLEAEEALEIINKRLTYHSLNKNAASNNIKRISIEAMEKILQNVNYRTPREVMLQVNNIFSSLKKGEEIITPYNILQQVDKRSLALIKRRIKSKTYVKLNKNLMDIQKELSVDDFSNAIKLLCEFFRKTNMTTNEWEMIYKEFGKSADEMRVIRSALLVKDLVLQKKQMMKEKKKYSTVQYTQTYYTLREDLRNLFVWVERTFHAFPEDYLERIFTDETISDKTIKVGTKDEQLDKVSLNLEFISVELEEYKKIRKTINHVERAIENHGIIIKYLESTRSTIQPDLIVQSMRRTVVELLSSIKIYRERSSDITIDEQLLLKDAINEFCEEYSEWYPKLETIRVEGIQVTKELMEDLIDYYMVVTHEITHNFLKDLRLDKILTIYPYELKREERVDFYKIRDMVSQEELFEAASNLRFLYERFLRKFIKEELEFHLGNKWESLIPNQILNRCKTEMAKDVKKNPLISEDYCILDYSYILDLKIIIESCWDKISGYFAKSGRKIDEDNEKLTFTAELLELNELRKRETHSRGFGPEYKNRVNQAITSALERVSRINIEKIKRKRGLDIEFKASEIEVDKNRAKDAVFVQLGSISGYISTTLWENFQSNNEIKEILLKGKPFTIQNLESIQIEGMSEWKEVLLCLAIAVNLGSYECNLDNKYFVFSKKD